MVKTAGFLLLKGNKFVLQRRDNKAQVAPNKLSIFGGHLKMGEAPKDGAIREIKEEVGLAINPDQASLLGVFYIPPWKGLHRKLHRTHIYEYRLTDQKLNVQEGRGYETYTMREILSRDDLDLDTAIILRKISKKWRLA